MKSRVRMTLVRENRGRDLGRNWYGLFLQGAKRHLSGNGIFLAENRVDVFCPQEFERMFPGCRLPPNYAQDIRLTIESDWWEDGDRP